MDWGDGEGTRPTAGQSRALAAVSGALAHAGPGHVVALVGPLGVGKSTLLAFLARGEPVIEARRAGARVGVRRALGSARPVVYVDGDEGPGLARTVREELDRAGSDAPRVVVTSRRPLLPARSPAGPLTSVPVPPWNDEEIRSHARALGLETGVDLVAGLAGGIPLVAACLARALLSGVPAEAPGAVADRALRELSRRLARERAASRARDVLDSLAVVGHGDEELLGELVEGPRGQGWFSALADLSLVTTTTSGLAVAEPFRTLLDLSYRWRRPVAHQVALTRAAARNRRRLDSARGGARRPLTEHALFLTGHPLLRETLFPPGAEGFGVRRATPRDHDRIGELVRQWAARRGVATARCERLLDGWLTSTADGFHLVCGPDDRPLGMTYTPRITDEALGVIEPLTQQHTTRMLGGGVFTGMAVCEHPGAHAALLRHIVAEGISGGRLVISTPSPQYQDLVQAFGFDYWGDTRHDPYDCGRASKLYHERFTWEGIPAWLDKVAALTSPRQDEPDRRWWTRAVRQALEHLRDDTGLARNPLLAVTLDPTPQGLRSQLVSSIRDLAEHEDPVLSQCGRILRAYYLRGHQEHHAVARQLHLSRATYFRRLDRGLAWLTQHLLSRDEPE
ncbi:hypothetical protein C1701_24270 [Actinoalloteichus sp. AHMU CJ021]|uniref:hypothetical protein n=1 Tax=Actinoalloteichus sp. AHMU CJ021 TaxID=2072503 RepID=UPI000CA007C4|nr:hypothetical protein C1701_24270 [Actinoalloteichus sp. AHMU CJ021]